MTAIGYGTVELGEHEHGLAFKITGMTTQGDLLDGGCVILSPEEALDLGWKIAKWHKEKTA